MPSKTRNQPLPSRADSGLTMATEHRTKGISLVKGPVGLIGLALFAYGITALIFGGHGFGQHAPNGAVHGKTWLGLEVNGWSAALFIAAGLLLLLAAPLHWGAKGMSLIVGLALGVGAAIALVNGNGALGIFAANHLTELVWGAAAALLIVLSLLPRVGGKTKQRSATARRAEPEPRIVEREHAAPEVRAADPLRGREPPAPIERTRAADSGSTESTAATESIAANGARTRTLIAPASGTTPDSRDATAEVHSANGTSTPSARR